MTAKTVLYFISLCLTQCSILVFCRRLLLLKSKTHRAICDTVIGSCILWGIGAALAASLKCSPLQQIGHSHIFCTNIVSQCLFCHVSILTSEDHAVDEHWHIPCTARSRNCGDGDDDTLAASNKEKQEGVRNPLFSAKGSVSFGKGLL